MNLVRVWCLSPGNSFAHRNEVTPKLLICFRTDIKTRSCSSKSDLIFILCQCKMYACLLACWLACLLACLFVHMHFHFWHWTIDTQAWCVTLRCPTLLIGHCVSDVQMYCYSLCPYEFLIMFCYITYKTPELFCTPLKCASTQINCCTWHFVL